MRKFARRFLKKRIDTAIAASAFYRVIENFQADEPLALSWPRLFPRFGVIYLVKLKSSGSTPLTTTPRTRYPSSSRDPLFLALSRFPRSEWLSPISSFYAYTLNFRLFLFLFDYSTFLVLSFDLYRTATVFQIHVNLLMSASSLFPIAHFLFCINIIQLLFLFLVRLYLFDLPKRSCETFAPSVWFSRYRYLYLYKSDIFWIYKFKC